MGCMLFVVFHSDSENPEHDKHNSQQSNLLPIQWGLFLYPSCFIIKLVQTFFICIRCKVEVEV